MKTTMKTVRVDSEGRKPRLVCNDSEITFHKLKDASALTDMSVVAALVKGTLIAGGSHAASPCVGIDGDAVRRLVVWLLALSIGLRTRM